MLKVLLCAALLSQTEARAQAVRQPASPADSVAALRSALQAKKLFERMHTLAVSGLFPWPKVSPGAAICEFVVQGTDYCVGPRNGKLVLFHKSPIELKSLYSFYRFGKSAEKAKWFALKHYLANFEKAAAIIPGDRWLAAERVSIFIEHALPDSAINASRRCGAERWYCAALQAYVLNEMRHHERADSAWSSALVQMDSVMRCAFQTDTGVVSDSALRADVVRMSCQEREKFFTNLWWLADPLWGDKWNERRAEQLSRRALIVLFPQFAEVSDSLLSEMARIAAGTDTISLQERAEQSLVYRMPRAAPFRPAGGATLIERMGEPHVMTGSSLPHHFLGLYVLGHYAFIPNAAAILNPLESESTDWNLHLPAAYERMAALPRLFKWLEYQVAFFRRGDSARVIVASDTERDHDLRLGLVAASVVLQPDPATNPVISRTFNGPIYRFDFAAPSERTVASVELAALGGPAGRIRFGAGPPDLPKQRLSVSDVLVLNRSTRLPTTLDEAAKVCSGSHFVDIRYPLGLFWEIYGLESGERPQLSVELRELPPGFFGRLARSILGRADVRVLATAWESEAASGAAHEGRSINLSLATLKPGRYFLTVSAEVPGQEVVRTSREIEIIARGIR